jgi:hypothetical protein
MLAEVLTVAPIDLLVRVPQSWRLHVTVVEALDVWCDFQ